MTPQGVLRLLIALVAAGLFVLAGTGIVAAASDMDIHSVGGQTIDEAFYQAFGLFAKALGTFSYAMAALSLAVGVSQPPVTVVQTTVAAPVVTAHGEPGA